MAIITKSTNNNFKGGCGEKRTFLLCCRQCIWIEPLWRRAERVRKKLGIKLPYDLAMSLLGRRKPEVQKIHVTLMFTAAPLPTARTGKQPRFHPQMCR